MKILDAFVIAWTKFRAKKVRTILTALLTSLTLIILVGSSLGATGLKNSISNVIGESDNYVVELTPRFSDISNDHDANGSDVVKKAVDETYIKQTFKSYDIKDTHVIKLIFSSYRPFGDFNGLEYKKISINDKEFIKKDPSNFNLSFGQEKTMFIATRPDKLLEEHVEDTSVFEIDEGDTVLPVIARISSLPKIAQKSTDNLDPEEKSNLYKELISQYQDQELNIDIEFFEYDENEARGIGQNDAPSHNLRFTIKIVGFMPNDTFTSGLFFGGDEEDFIAPQSAYSKITQDLQEGNTLLTHIALQDIDPSLLEFSGDEYINTMLEQKLFLEFNSEEEAKRFVKDGHQDVDDRCFEFDPVALESEEELICYHGSRVIRNASIEFDQAVSNVWGVIKYIVGFFAINTAILIFFTTSKIISESERETGVFRAMGAKRFDIARIYFSYLAIIISTAFILSLVISIILLTIIKIYRGDEVSNRISDVAGNYAQEIDLSFIGFNFMHLLIILGASMLIGLVGGIIPILRSVFSDPIKSMRSE